MVLNYLTGPLIGNLSLPAHMIIWNALLVALLTWLVMRG
jgi:antibiotic biosynthesis monooxygenase (ABM) superfamily enzyme